MSGQEPSRPDKGKTVKKARKAKYVVRVPKEIPFSNARARPDVGCSRRPPPSSTMPTPSVGPTPSTIGPTPSTIGPTPSTIGPTPSTIGPTPSTIGPTPPTVVPTPSVVGQTPYIHPSSIPTPPSIPSPDVHQPSADVADVADSADTADLDDPAPHDRPFIEPCGKGFLPSRVASQAITRTIKQQFLQPWASWGVISDDDKKLFWERFKVKPCLT
ncbi:vegetative cell wall protein gp1-like [Vigna radiata var. radiata]|uniref:Vegetative cell wall protein gp1-like n=1 Tax=Vigna radiata var. radiata TaxID=3916 RepID=A0A3Q0ENP3_VIGRR|nr:vegetative cell wall protein gp1-like [Vigna radiata var. radiata]